MIGFLPMSLYLIFGRRKNHRLQVLIESMSRRGPEAQTIVMTCYDREEDFRHAMSAATKAFLANTDNAKVYLSLE